MIDPRDFGRLEGKVDQILSMQTEDRSARTKLEKEVASIKTDDAYRAGRNSVYAMGLSAVVSLVIGIGSRQWA